MDSMAYESRWRAARDGVGTDEAEEERVAGQWYYCLRHNRVEGEDGCANIDRMGPYATEEEAASAPARARERTEAWDAEDARWDGEK